MDFGLREWLLIIGPIFVIGILLHGYWRMRANRNPIKMSLDKSFTSSPGEKLSTDEDLSMLRAELPSGGARVRRQEELEQQHEQQHEQPSVDNHEDVPVLMEPVEIGRRGEPGGDRRADRVAEEKPIVPEREAPVPSDQDEGAIHAIRPEHEGREDEKPREERPEYFIVLYITALHEDFRGQELLESLVELDMQFGEMNIFHRKRDGESIFSLVNAVEPGTFDIGGMSELSTPAVSLFMRGHEVPDPVAVYDAMIEVAQALADDLGGEVKDDSRSVVTPQTIEHRREQIRDYLHRHPY